MVKQLLQINKKRHEKNLKIRFLHCVEISKRNNIQLLYIFAFQKKKLQKHIDDVIKNHKKLKNRVLFILFFSSNSLFKTHH